MSGMEIILASGSPRRRALMGRLADSYRVFTVDVDESSEGETDPVRIVETAAVRKARAAAAFHPNAIVIGADTVVAADGRILGKPADRGAARSMLEFLSGRAHRVVTGIALFHARLNRLAVGHETTAVTFRTLTAAMIETYLSREDYADKAGAYGIQDIGDEFVADVDGDYDNVVGFPVARVAAMLSRFDRDP
jgi:septum formation protein